MSREVTPEIVAWVRAQSPDWQDSDSAIAAALNAVTVDNPEPAPLVLPVLSAMVLFQRVGAESRARLGNYTNLPDVRREILADQRGPLCNWIQVLAASGVITGTEATNAITFLNTPAPDPDWPDTLAQTVVALGREVTPQDVATARYQRAQEAIAARADTLQQEHPGLSRRAALEQADEELRNGE